MTAKRSRTWVFGALAVAAGLAAGAGLLFWATMDPQQPSAPGSPAPGKAGPRPSGSATLPAGALSPGGAASLSGRAAATAHAGLPADDVHRKAVLDHGRRLQEAERRFEQADQTRPLPAAMAEAFRRDIKALRESFKGEITDADWQCHGQHCRLKLMLRSGVAIKALLTRAMWLGGDSSARCTYQALSEPGPPPPRRPQTLRAYYVCEK